MTFELFRESVLPVLNAGFWITVQLIIPSALLGFLGGVLLGSVRAFGFPILRRLGDAYTTIFRGVPLVMQLLFIYFGLPAFGLALDAFDSAVTGFILCSAAYHSEYIRGALLSIKDGQIKAAHALGFSNAAMLRSIILPQALRRALPGCGNEIIYLIKYSSLAYIVPLDQQELLGSAQSLTSYVVYPAQIFIAAGLYYLTLTTLATWMLHLLEKWAYIPGFGKRK